jgi:hypothetical protein
MTTYAGQRGAHEPQTGQGGGVRSRSKQEESLTRRAELRYVVPVLACLALGCHALPAQSTAQTSVELAVAGEAQRSLELNTDQNFWAAGGAIELGVNAFHGLGLGASITGAHAASIGSTGTPLSLVTETFGPRYRWHDGHRVSLYGEGLVGEANGFRSLFPATSGAQADANGLAVRTGGGVDLRLGRHFSVRALEAAWLYTRLPNSADGVQNNLLLGAGVVLHTGRR